MTLHIFLTLISKRNSGGRGGELYILLPFKKDMLYVGDAILIALCWYKMQYFQTAIGVFQGSTWWKQVAAAVLLLLEKETFIAPVWLLATNRRTQWVYMDIFFGKGWFDWHWKSPSCFWIVLQFDAQFDCIL